MLPTLLRTGFIVPPKGISKKDKERIGNTIAIEYIRDFLSDRVPKTRGMHPKLRPKKYGDKVIVIKAETGSGKSTIIPPDLYLAFIGRVRKNIIVTQPRILTAIDIPNIIVHFVPELELDKNIGYNTMSHKRIPQERGIIFSTIGVLTQQLINDEDEKFMQRYHFILIDEVHERDIETDLCLFLLKRLIEKNYDNPDCPIIILMSATIDEQIFIEYFDVPAANYIEVIGSTHPITEQFTDYSVSNYLQFAAAKAKKLHLSGIEDLTNKFRDIIIFVKDSGVGKKIYDDLTCFNTFLDTATQSQIDKYLSGLDKELAALLKKGGAGTAEGGGTKDNKLYILPILLDKVNFDKGGLEYQNLFSRLETINVPIWKKGKDQPIKYVKPVRRIIISTNIAETGVTIPTLKYCIDTGYHFSVEFNPEIGCAVNFTKSITKGMATQRRGRVGRNAPGTWEPCYTKITYEAMQENQYSKIITSDTTDNLLGILIKENELELKLSTSNETPIPMFHLTDEPYMLDTLKDTNISALDFIELPAMQTLGYSLEKLHILGFINDQYHITPLGYFANKIRFIPLETRRMIMAGYKFGANILDLITISAFVYVSKRRTFAKGFNMSNYLSKSDAEFAFYNQVLIGDEFINCVFIWNLLQEYLTKKLKTVKKSGEGITGALYLPTIQAWCDENGLVFDGLLQVIALREQIIENMITIGMNPYYNSLDLPKYRYNLLEILRGSMMEGLEEIKKIKCCLYEGFKCNLMSNNRGSYICVLKNTKVKIKSPLMAPLAERAAQKMPQYIVVDSYILTQKYESAQFEFLADGFISILDGYVNVDETFYTG